MLEIKSKSSDDNDLSSPDAKEFVSPARKALNLGGLESQTGGVFSISRSPKAGESLSN